MERYLLGIGPKWKSSPLGWIINFKSKGPKPSKTHAWVPQPKSTTHHNLDPILYSLIPRSSLFQRLHLASTDNKLELGNNEFFHSVKNLAIFVIIFKLITDLSIKIIPYRPLQLVLLLNLLLICRSKSTRGSLDRELLLTKIETNKIFNNELLRINILIRDQEHYQIVKKPQFFNSH